MCFGGGSQEPKVIKRENSTFSTVTPETPDITQRVMEGGPPNKGTEAFGSTLGTYSNTNLVNRSSGS